MTKVQARAGWRSANAGGTVVGLLGVLAFSLTLPATRAAVPDLGAAFVGLGRALGAACLVVGSAALTQRTRAGRRCRACKTWGPSL